MNPNSAHAQRRQQTIRMMHEVLNGEPLQAVSARVGISRSSVERRVKALALQLTHVVGVEGLKENGAASLTRLRRRRDAVLSALGQLDPMTHGSHRSTRVLTPAEVDLAALRVRSRANRPPHDLALFHLAFATGLRPLEVARLEVADYLTQEGSVRRESQVRADVAINGRARPLFFAHRQLDEALAVYLETRVQVGHGVGSPGNWRGLDPCSPLFLDDQGEPYAITTNGGTGQRRFVCRALLEIYRRIFRHADIHGLCTQSARLTLMARMYERGADEDQVGLVLGIADRSAVRGQLPRPRQELSRLLAG